MRSTGEIISQTVRNLLARAVSQDLDALAQGDPKRVYSQKLNELADHLGVSHPYMPRKVKSGTWSAEDIDRLAAWFDIYPQDLVPGPHDDWGVPSQMGDASTDVTPERQNPESTLPESDTQRTE